MHSDNATSHRETKPQFTTPTTPVPLFELSICIFENHLFSGLIKRANEKSDTAARSGWLIIIFYNIHRISKKYRKKVISNGDFELLLKIGANSKFKFCRPWLPLRPPSRGSLADETREDSCS